MAVLTLRLHRITRSGEARELAEMLQDRPESWVQNPWGYVDARDNAQACALCLQAENLGFEVFNATAADMLSVVSMGELIRRYCLGVEIRHRIEGTESAWSTEKAERVLGCHPRHSWRDSTGASEKGRA